MTTPELITSWLAKYPGRGGADLVELVDAAVEAGRAPVRQARDVYAGKVARLTAELAATCDQLEALDAYREQATAFAEALVELGRVDIVDQVLAEAQP